MTQIQLRELTMLQVYLLEPLTFQLVHRQDDRKQSIYKKTCELSKLLCLDLPRYFLSFNGFAMKVVKVFFIDHAIMKFL